MTGQGENLGLREQLALAIARGDSVSAAALKVGVPGRTARSWNSKATFKRRVATLRDRMMREVCGGLLEASKSAVERLGALIRSPDEGVAVRACRVVLANASSYHGQAIIASQVDELIEAKAAMEVRDHAHPPSHP